MSWPILIGDGFLIVILKALLSWYIHRRILHDPELDAVSEFLAKLLDILFLYERLKFLTNLNHPVVAFPEYECVGY